MPGTTKKRSSKQGLPPGSLVYVGDKPHDKTLKITVIDYDEHTLDERTFDDVTQCFVFKDKPSVTWINIESVHLAGVLERLGECYGFHPLVLEDIMNTEQRPKVEDFGEYMYLVLKMLTYDGASAALASEQVSVIFGPNYVISFQEGIEGDAFEPIRERIRSGKGRIRGQGADYLAYSLMDAIVDKYFTVLEGVGERIETLEQELLTKPDNQSLATLHALKREMLFLRKIAWPLREVISNLQKSDSALIGEHTRLYFRDVYDHVIQIIDTIETFRDMLSGLLDVYLSSVSNRMNEVMKVLTVIATIFIPLTFIAGVYGMNFKYMPELEWPWGYPLIWAVMLGAAAGMLYYFRRKKWF